MEPDLTQNEFWKIVTEGPQPYDCVGPMPHNLKPYYQEGLQKGAWHKDNRGVLYAFIPWRRKPWLEHRGPLYPLIEAHDTHLKIIEGICPEHDSILDVGGYDGSWAWLFEAKYKVVVDICAEALDRWAAIHTEAFYMDAGNLGYLSYRSFDVVFLLDVLEHLEPEKALCCIDAAEKIAKNQVIVVTPDGWMSFDESVAAWQDMKDVPCLDGMRHLSGWNKQFFIDRGYKVLVQEGQHSFIGGGDALVCFYNKWEK